MLCLALVLWICVPCRGATTPELESSTEIITSWDRILGGELYRFLRAVTETPEGDLLLTGTLEGGGFWITRTDRYGAGIWDIQERSNVGGYPAGLHLTSRGDLLVAGMLTQPGHRSTDLWLAWYDRDGNFRSEAFFGGTANEEFAAFFPTEDEGFIMGGSSFSKPSLNKTATNHGGRDYWLAKLSLVGEIEWDRSYGGRGNDQLTSVVVTRDGGFLLHGHSGSAVSGTKTTSRFGYWVIRVDPSGNELWQRSFGGEGASSSASKAIQTADGGFVVGGQSGATGGNKDAPSYGKNDFWIVKLDEDGNKLWDKSYGGTDEDSIRTILETSDRGLLLGGWSVSGADGNRTSVGFGGIDYWVVKLDQSGEVEWEHEMGGAKDDALESMVLASEGNVLAAGGSRSEVSGNKSAEGQGIWLVKFAAVEPQPPGVPTIRINGLYSPLDYHRIQSESVIDISSSYENATIVYTLDGSTPTVDSPVFTGPFSLSASATLRALAFSADFLEAAESRSVNVEFEAPIVDASTTYRLTVLPSEGGSVDAIPVSEFLPKDAEVQLVATPDEGLAFMHWLGDVDGSGPSSSVTMNDDKYVQAVFGRSIVASVAGGGRVELSPDPLVPVGHQARLTAIPDEGFRFALWGNEASGSISPFQLPLDGSVSDVSALFVPLGEDEFSLVTLVAGNGSVSVEPPKNVFQEGETITLQAIPEVGQRFVGWFGDLQDSQNTVSHVMNGNTTIGAEFEPLRFPVLLTQLGLTSDDALILHLSGEASVDYLVESSTDLAEWAPISIVNTPEGATTFLVEIEDQKPIQYFRARTKKHP